MRDDRQPTPILLAELRQLLGSDQLPVQQEIASGAGVHQSMVSRARRGQLRRWTDKAEALLKFARSRVGEQQAALAAAEAMKKNPVGVARRPKGAEARGTIPSEATMEVFRQQALRGIETYLSDGYDPRLVVEQLAVLRRAQRVRRAGRPDPERSEGGA
ncbi:MAG: hypothetical protein KGJ57_19370 [Sphingomonadales bacterium]|nr:hypothetical protein [Sphingomonadales bacterium]MDE2171556.1 hypothetical protein [Sphingomonadales bacterium]